MAEEPQSWQTLNDIVNRVFERTERYKVNQSELAETAGLSASTISRLRNYRTRLPRFETVFKLCQAVGIEIFTTRHYRRRAV